MWVVVSCVAFVAVACLASTTDDAVWFLGHEVPTVCMWRSWLGFECLGCGLTRSVVYAADLQLFNALRLHVAGPLLLAVVAGQVPWRLVRLWRSR